MAQLPPEAQGVAVAILVYSFLCFFCNLLMLWLLWTSRQTFSHIGVICMFTAISIVVNITQQIHDNLFWADVMKERFEQLKADVDNPWLSASNGCTGLDFGLWTIRYTTQTIAAGLACFWALSLAQAVYGWTRGNWTFINAAGKVISVLLPLIFINLCFWEPIHDSHFLFYMFFDFCFVLFVGGGAILLFLIIVKYVQTGRELKKWRAEAGFGDLDQASWRKLSFRIDDGSAAAPQNVNVFAQTTGIYDRWLIIRFSIAFVFMILFVVNMCIIQATGHADMVRDSLEPVPDLSPGRARRDLALLMPGEISGVLALVTFGTTKHFRETLYRTFVPTRWQRAAAAPEPVMDEEFKGGGSAYARAMTPMPPLGAWAPASLTPGGGRDPSWLQSINSKEGGTGHHDDLGWALGHRFGDRGSWTRGVQGLPAPGVPLHDLKSPVFRDSVWREGTTLSPVPEYV